MELDVPLQQMLEGPAPCDQCQFFLECKQNELACYDFLDFLSKGEVKKENRQATHELFIRAYYNRESVSLSSEDLELIKTLSKIRGLSHRKLAEKFEVIPRLIKLIIDGEIDTVKDINIG